MRILLVTHNYAPDPNPRAYRWTAIAEEWARQGVQVDVVTTGRRNGERTEDQNGVHLHRVGEERIGRLAGQSVKDTPDGSETALSASGAGPMIHKVVRAIYDHVWKAIYWPDYACLWYRPALREAKRLYRTQRYDGVISVSHPFTGHLVGLGLKKAFPALRWVADMGDPFSASGTVPSNNLFFYRRLNRRMEAAVLRHSDAISVTVDGCRNLFVDEFRISPQKIRVIPPLLSLQPGSANGAPPFEKNGSIDLVYLGVLYPEIRKPDAILALFAVLQSRMKNLRLHFFGHVQGCEAAFARYPDLMKTAVFLHPAVPRSSVPAILSASDALINIGNDTSHQLPSKLIEYIAGGRPILNVVANKTDTSAVFLENYPRALTVVCEEGMPTAEQVEKAKTFLEQTPEISRSDLDEFVAQFHVSPITRAYEELTAGP